MGRPLRPDPPGGWHHVMNRGADRQPIFRTRGDAAVFVEHLGAAVTEAGASVVAYCLMTNHFHLLVRCDDGGLSGVMHSVGSKYVRFFNDRAGRDGPLFRSRFLSKQVDSWEYRVGVARYIHRNPLDIGRPEPLSSFRWSSYPVYLGLARAPEWLDPTPVLDVFGGDLVAYRESVEEKSSGLDAPLDCLLGLIEMLAGEIDGLDSTARRSLCRNVGVALLDELAGDRRDRLADVLAFSSRDTERVARKRARRTLTSDPNARLLLDRLRAA